jgi:hypothetical protein
MRWVVNATPRPLYPWERPGTNCIGGWVGPRIGLDRCGKSRPHRDSIPGPHTHRGTLLNRDTICLYLYWTYIVIVSMVINKVTHIHTQTYIHTYIHTHIHTYIHTHIHTYARTDNNKQYKWQHNQWRTPRHLPTTSMVAQNTWYRPQEMFGNGKPSHVCNLAFLPFWKTNYRNCLKGYCAAVLHPTQKITSNATRHLSIFYSALRPSLTFPNSHFITKVYRKSVAYRGGGSTPPLPRNSQLLTKLSQNTFVTT